MGEPLVVEAEETERGGVEVVAVGGVFLGLGTELIRRAVSRAAPDAAAREAQRKQQREALVDSLPDQWPGGEVRWETVKPTTVEADGEDFA